MIIITLVKNDLEGLKRTLASVFNSKFQDLFTEILIVDGNSSDGSFELCRKIIGSYQNVSLVRRDPKGIYDAMNHALIYLASKQTNLSEPIIFLHAGDFLLDASVLPKMEKLLEEYRWVTGLVSVSTYKKYPNFQVIPLDFSYQNGPNPNEYWIPHQALAIRLKDILEVGLFECSYELAGDYDHTAKLWLKFGPPKIINEVVVGQLLNGISNIKTYKGFREKNALAVKLGYPPLKISFLILTKWWLKEKLFTSFPKLNPEKIFKKRTHNSLNLHSCGKDLQKKCFWCSYRFLYKISEKMNGFS